MMPRLLPRAKCLVLSWFWCSMVIRVDANAPPRFILNPGGGEGDALVVRLPEGQDTPVGQVILNLDGVDPDGDTLTFGVASDPDQVVRVANADDDEGPRNRAVVVLTRELDYEVKRQHEVVLSLTDGKLGGAASIVHSLLILVEDINDNPPVFQPYNPSVAVSEVVSDGEAKVGEVLTKLAASDRDSGIYGQIAYSLQTPDDANPEQPTFALRDEGEDEDGNRVVAIVLNHPEGLDFEQQRLYQLQILASDLGGHGDPTGSSRGQPHTAAATILVQVLDKPDRPPEFLQVPSISRIPEDALVGTKVSQVRAVDGDRGINDKIIYSIISGPQLFSIDEETGVISTASLIDREDDSLLNSNGAVVIQVRATEAGSREFADVEVTIFVEDVNDELPTFRSSVYSAELDENSPRGTPITFLGGVTTAISGHDTTNNVPEVLDRDRGTNGTFLLFLEGDDNLFEVSPGRVTNEARFIIKVRDDEASLRLDYELAPELTFTLVAQEIGPAGRRSEAAVHVRLRDVNDHIPEFEKTVYEVEVPEFHDGLVHGDHEGAKDVVTVAAVRATDSDTGLFGTDGIRYTVIRGPANLVEHLHLNETTGVITMSKTSRIFDRETVDFHYLTVEARDELGLGNRNTVELLIRVVDVNDHPPRFSADEYSAELEENRGFDQGEPVLAVVHASDADLAGSPNAKVRYRISGGSGALNFSVHPQSGEIRPLHSIDFEAILPNVGVGDNVRQDRKRLDLLVTAYDLGTVSMSSEVTVNIYIVDMNDNAPKFGLQFYNGSVLETAPEGTKVVQVEAADADGSSPNNRVFYRIQRGASDKFAIDPRSGQITVSPEASLDLVSAGATNSYSLEVAALDEGSPQLSTTVLVNITVIDVNNKVPYFVGLDEPLHVQENLASGTLVGQLNAIDPDEGASLAFSIDWNSSKVLDGRMGDFLLQEETPFRLDSKSGRLYCGLQGCPDREAAGRFMLTVLVEDTNALSEAPGLNRTQVAVGQVVVMVDDVNDNPPKFGSVEYVGFVTENAAPGTSVLRVEALDPDLNEEAAVQYSLRGSQLVLDLVRIDERTGEIFVSSMGSQHIDYESMHHLNFTAVATDSGDPGPLETEVPVILAVLDVNDNDPVFPKGHGFPHSQGFQFKVSEDAEPGTLVGRVEASDLDSGDYGKVTYFLDKLSSSSSTSGKFSIDPDSGEIRVRAPLDREEHPSMSLIALAYDNYQFGFTTGGSRHAFTQVTILVTDANDEAPQLVVEPENLQQASDNCSATVDEFHPIKDPVFTSTAFDPDDPGTQNGQVRFEIVGAEPEDQPSLALFRLEVKPVQGGVGTSSSHSKRQGLKGGPIESRGDEPLGGRYRLSFYATRSLVGSQGQHLVTVRAVDGGFPPNVVEGNFTICVQDFNDHAPVFDDPAANLTIRVPENATLGTEVTRVHATDEDSGPNGQVRYRLKPDPLGHHRTFKVDATSGSVTLARPLDRESQKRFEIRLEAFDMGQPAPLVSDLDLSIYVKNVNDHSPKFLVDHFDTVFVEHREPGLDRVRLPDTVDRDEEDDPDYYLKPQEHPGDVCYFVVGDDDGDDSSRTFSVHPISHELMAIKELDREAKANYTLIVKATEDCFHAYNPVSSGAGAAGTVWGGAAAFDPQDDTLLMVRIEVGDIDDRSPTFTKRVYRSGVSAGVVDHGSVLLQVRADDADEGENAKVRYEAVGDGGDLVASGSVLVDPETGQVSLNSDPLRWKTTASGEQRSKHLFRFRVKATDKLGHHDEAEVQLYLMREDQKVRLVVRGHPNEMRARVEDLEAALSNATGCLVHVDSVLALQGDKTKSDILMHFSTAGAGDGEAWSVMEATEALKMIDLMTEQLDPIFREFNVLHTEPVSPVEQLEGGFRTASTVYTGGHSSQTVLILWMGGLCAFLFGLLALVLSLCLHQRSKYLRKLRAATVAGGGVGGPGGAASGLPPRIPAASNTVPNTNMHTVEGSNPLWMTHGVSYDNENFLENDEDDDEDLDLSGNLSEDSDEDDVEHGGRSVARGDSAGDLANSLDSNVLNVPHPHSGDSSFGTATTIRAGSSRARRTTTTPEEALPTTFINTAALVATRPDSRTKSSQSSGRGSELMPSSIGSQHKTSSLNTRHWRPPRPNKVPGFINNNNNNNHNNNNNNTSSTNSTGPRGGPSMSDRNLSFDLMFPPQMPPVEVFGSRDSSGSSSSSVGANVRGVGTPSQRKVTTTVVGDRLARSEL